MKKVISLLLCLILVCTMLVSCKEEKIGDYLDKYPEDPLKAEELTLNLYIIVGDGTSDSAMTSVSRELNAHTHSKLNTKLNVYYVSESEYETTVINAVKEGIKDIDSGNYTSEAAKKVPHIVLINSVSLINSLHTGKNGNSYLADLTSYIEGNTYGTLNTQIPKALIQGSRIDGMLYTVPNNHIIGEYTYLVINKDVARSYGFSNRKIETFKTMEDASELVQRMTDDGKSPAEIEAAVFIKNGPYEMKSAYEADGFFCNVSVYPTVTPEIAFSSAFAVISQLEDKYNQRSMQLIYEINTNVEFRNLLQYGVEDTNYTLDNGVVTRKTDAENVYNMNLIYTGDIFKAYYCEDFEWTLEKANNAFNQNEESVVAK